MKWYDALRCSRSSRIKAMGRWEGTSTEIPFHFSNFILSQETQLWIETGR